MERVIESYINGATVDIVRMKLRDLVSAERDMKLLCTLLLENVLHLLCLSVCLSVRLSNCLCLFDI